MPTNSDSNNTSLVERFTPYVSVLFGLSLLLGLWFIAHAMGPDDTTHVKPTPRAELFAPFTMSTGKSDVNTRAIIYVSDLKSDGIPGNRYNLDADITVSADSPDNDVQINKIYWPNGGSATFSDCSLNGYLDVNCKDQSGHTYVINVPGS
jgi:hypothetical protein